MNTIRCKFVVAHILNVQGATVPMADVVLDARYDPEKSAEDVSFAEAAPQGRLSFKCTNPDVLKQLEVGQAYYVDLVPISAA